jgi:hypothetical protein
MYFKTNLKIEITQEKKILPQKNWKKPRLAVIRITLISLVNYGQNGFIKSGPGGAALGDHDVHQQVVPHRERAVRRLLPGEDWMSLHFLTSACSIK